MTPPVAVAPRKELLPVQCPYCREDAELTDKGCIYTKVVGGNSGKVWLCRPCRAWVGIHGDSATFAPLGRLAKSELRAKRVKALFYFDQVWQSMVQHRGWSPHKARAAAYGWLAREMHIEPRGCNIYAFDDAATQVVIDICMAVGAKKDVAA